MIVLILVHPGPHYSELVEAISSNPNWVDNEIPSRLSRFRVRISEFNPEYAIQFEELVEGDINMLPCGIREWYESSLGYHPETITYMASWLDEGSDETPPCSPARPNLIQESIYEARHEWRDRREW